MIVQEVLKNKPYAKIGTEAAYEQHIKQLEDKLELTLKILQNVAMRLDNLELELYRGK